MIVIMEPNVKFIREYAFAECINLTLPVINNSQITTIERGVFYNCNRMDFIGFPNSAKYIKEDAFSGCESLKYIMLEEKIISIGERAFGNCFELEYLFLTAKIKKIKAVLDEKCKNKELYQWVPLQ